MPNKCKVKQAQSPRAHYLANREKMVNRAMERTAKQRILLRQVVFEYLSKHPCIDCEEPDPIVLEFDHRDPSVKRDAVANMVRDGLSVKTVLDEIAKCDVRCANCHRRRHAAMLSMFSVNEVPTTTSPQQELGI